MEQRFGAREKVGGSGGSGWSGVEGAGGAGVPGERLVGWYGPCGRNIYIEQKDFVCLE